METAEDMCKLLEQGLREVAEGSRVSDAKDMIPRIFGMAMSDRAFEEFYEVSDIGDHDQWEGRFTTSQRYPGYLTRVEFKRFYKRITSDPQLIEDNQYDVLNDTAAAMMKSYNRTREKWAAKLFQYATSAAFDFMEKEEGLSLANSSHTTKVPGVSTSSGFSNVGSSTFDPVELEAAVISIKRFRSAIGELMDDEDQLAIIHPVSLMHRVEEVIGTDRGLYTPDGTLNVHNGRYSSVPWVRLDDVSTSSWGLMKVNSAKKNAVFYDRLPAKYSVDIDRNTLATVHQTQGRFGYAWKDWRWLYWENA